MARRSASPVADKIDALRLLAQGLKTQSKRTNAYGYKPHSKQEEFHRALAHLRLYIGGNRAGKTVGGVMEDIWWATDTHPFKETPPPPIRGRVVGVDLQHGVGQILIPEFKRWVVPSTLLGGSWDKAYDNYKKVLTFSNGSTIEFMSYEQDQNKFAGTSRHFVHYDEEPPYDIYEECEARLIDTDGMSWMTLTPVEGMTWIYDAVYLKAGIDKDIFAIEVSMSDNPHINVEAKNRFLGKLTVEAREAREEGKFIQLGGLVFKDFHKLATSRYVVDSVIPPVHWNWYLSVDHGYNNPTCWLWHAVSPSNEVITFAEHYASEMTVKQHADIVKQMCEAFKRPLDDYYLIVGDPAMGQRNAVEGLTIIQEYAKHGIYIMPGNNDVHIGVNQMQSFMKDMPKLDKPYWHITETCPNLIREMGRLRWATWAGKKAAYENNRHEKIHKKNDHAPDSARYFFTCLPELNPDEPAAVSKFLVREPGARYDEGLMDSSWSVKESIHSGYLDDSITALEYD